MNDDVKNPFGSTAVAARSSSALVSVEQQRAVAQVQAAMLVARSMPRDRIAVMDLILQDCTEVSVAEESEYEFSRGGSKISGPSIRLLETVARRWGNMECGVKELSRANGYSECEAFAWDMETGFRDSKSFQVKHWRDTKQGGYPITEERDIYELIANSAARRKRACLEAVIPAVVVRAASDQCQLTLKTKIDITPEFIAGMLAKFAEFGVTKEQIEKRIQRHMDALTPGLAIQLRRVFNSLKDGMSQPSEWFESVDAPAAATTEKPKTGAAALKEKVASKKSDPAGAAKNDNPPPNKTQPADDPTLNIPGAGDISHVGGPGIDFVKLKAAIEASTDVDALDANATLIGDIADMGQQNTLAKLYTARREELTK
jgi:hypothetical protein